ncbi:hypothetical protein CKA34_21930 (plasmid) [Rhizobium sp. 11515TR]|nr:hypothetical protein CKA34_21930 [Rhizobium sp. 11515TR]
MSSTARRNNKKLLRLIYLLTWNSPCRWPRGDIRDDHLPVADDIGPGNDVATGVVATLTCNAVNCASKMT